ncbi:hypothetical protein [Moraxella lacunata]|uniref:hypothetical protein n=1 Tax=Moraxella lacunata TaxID=477 RepID=UPI003EDE9C73
MPTKPCPIIRYLFFCPPITINSIKTHPSIIIYEPTPTQPKPPTSSNVGGL